MLSCFTADLHIHTCLSPCGDLEMSPKRVVEKAVAKKLDIIAICDHNSAENVIATINAGIRNNIKVLAGMEITSSEEAHILALFEKAEAALDLQELIYKNLPGENSADIFGEQIVVNEFDEVEGFNKHLLIGTTNISLDQLVNEIHDRNGLAIAAHVDRQAFSIIGQLGFIPPDLELDALEISAHTDRAKALAKFPEIKKFSLTTSSDAHYLEDVGKASISVFLERPTFSEIQKAINNIDGRYIVGGINR